MCVLLVLGRQGQQESFKKANIKRKEKKNQVLLFECFSLHFFLSTKRTHHAL